MRWWGMNNGYTDIKTDASKTQSFSDKKYRREGEYIWI